MTMDPSPPVSPLTSDHRSPSKLSIWLRWLGLIIGLGLIITAVVVLLQQREVLTAALAAIRRPAPGYLALLLAGVAANVILTGIMFSLLMSRYGRVGLLEMQALIAAATLVNYLPLRPGLPGRIAYHKAVNQILAIHSAKTIVQASMLSLLMVAYLAAVIGLTRSLGGSDTWLWCGLLGPVPLLIAGSFVRSLRIWLLAGLVRYAEVFVWALRYYAAFKLIDLPISATESLLFACVSMIATMVPFVSNGLGLREWAVGLASPLQGVGRLEQGITAELVNRAAEMVMVLVLGLAGLAYLAARRRGRTSALQPGQCTDSADG